MIKLLVGLGNPGDSYRGTRHNIGFNVIDTLADKVGGVSFKKKFHGMIASCILEFGQARHEVLMMMPQTYMNLSGQAVSAMCAFYKIKPSEIIVFHDDIDLECGSLRIKQGGSAGGHNGLKSIDSHMGKDYWRVRLGVGRPCDGRDVSQFVLGSFNKEEQDICKRMIAHVIDLLPLMLEEKFADVSVRMGQLKKIK